VYDTQVVEFAAVAVDNFVKNASEFVEIVVDGAVYKDMTYFEYLLIDLDNYEHLPFDIKAYLVATL
jgi:hypothetical protein